MSGKKINIEPYDIKEIKKGKTRTISYMKRLSEEDLREFVKKHMKMTTITLGGKAAIVNMAEEARDAKRIKKIRHSRQYLKTR